MVRPLIGHVVWFLLAGFCAFVEFAGSFATNGRINGWGDLSFILVFAFVGLVALIQGFRCKRAVRGRDTYPPSHR